VARTAPTLCPTVSASGCACSACLVSARGAANAAEIATVLNECSPGANVPLAAIPYASVCLNVVEAASTCSNIQCQCPTLLASGSASSARSSASGFSSDVSGLVAFWQQIVPAKRRQFPLLRAWVLWLPTAPQSLALGNPPPHPPEPVKRVRFNLNQVHRDLEDRGNGAYSIYYAPGCFGGCTGRCICVLTEDML